MTDAFERFARGDASETDFRAAIAQLVRRHIRPGTTTLAELAALLDGAAWLRAEDVTLITDLGGKIPVGLSDGNTTVAIALPGGRGALYLAIAGRVSAEDIHATLRGTTSVAAVILEAAVWPPD